MSPMASMRASKVRAAMRLRWALSLEKACSIGFRSGEYCGRNSIHAPRAWTVASALALLWTERLSRIGACALPNLLARRHQLFFICEPGPA